MPTSQRHAVFRKTALEKQAPPWTDKIPVRCSHRICEMSSLKRYDFSAPCGCPIYTSRLIVLFRNSALVLAQLLMWVCEHLRLAQFDARSISVRVPATTSLKVLGMMTFVLGSSKVHMSCFWPEHILEEGFALFRASSPQRHARPICIRPFILVSGRET